MGRCFENKQRKLKALPQDIVARFEERFQIKVKAVMTPWVDDATHKRYADEKTREGMYGEIAASPLMAGLYSARAAKPDSRCFSHVSSLLPCCSVFFSVLDRASDVFGFWIVVIFGRLPTTSEWFCCGPTRHFPEIYAHAIGADDEGVGNICPYVQTSFAQAARPDEVAFRLKLC